MLVTTLIALLPARSGHAEPPKETARLTYVVASNAPRCPDEASFRNLVTARLGYDPFEPGGLHEASVEITREAGRLRARARVRRRGQAEPGARELTGALDACEALVSALATTVAIALDPARAIQGPAPPPPPPVQPPSPPPPSPPSPPPPSPPPPAPPPATEPVRASFSARASGVASIGAAPGPAVGGELGVALRVGVFSVEVGVRAESTPSATTVASGDRIEATLITASLVPCADLRGWSACALLRGGAFQGKALTVDPPTLQSSPFVAAGLRGGYTLHLAGPVSARADAEVAFALIRTSLIVGASPVWTAPPILGGVNLGVVVDFP